MDLGKIISNLSIILFVGGILFGAETNAESNSVSLAIMLIMLFFSVLLMISYPIISEFYMVYSQIEYDSEELVLILPSSRIISTRYQFPIRFKDIQKISFNDASSYVISFTTKPINDFFPPIHKISAVKPNDFVIPLRLIRDQNQEKKLWKAFESLNRYYNESGKDYVIYNPPTILYQRKLGANTIRNNNHDGVIFFVKKYQGE